MVMHGYAGLYLGADLPEGMGDPWGDTPPEVSGADTDTYVTILKGGDLGRGRHRTDVTFLPKRPSRLFQFEAVLKLSKS
jgi:hypothetical protein